MDTDTETESSSGVDSKERSCKKCRSLLWIICIHTPDSYIESF